MNAIPSTIAERAGKWFGRAWRGFARREAHVVLWLASQGLTTGVARLLLWVVKLAVLGLILYAMFWVALLLVLALAVAWLILHVDWRSDSSEPEWRSGPAGFGFYTYDGHRIDPHVHDDDD